MNSLQGGWGIQDRHDRVISWLSGIVVCLLVIYAIIFISRQVLPGEPVTPTSSPTPVVSAPPTPAPTAPTRGPRPPRIPTQIPTRTARLPDPTPSPTRTAPFVPTQVGTPAPTLVGQLPAPTERPRTFPTSLPPRPTTLPTRVASLPPVPTRVATLAPVPTRAPTRAVTLPTRAPTPPASTPSTVQDDGPYILRVGEAFSSGSQALAFARKYDVLQSHLVPESSRPGSRLFLEDGPFDTRQAAMQEMERLRRRVGDPSLPLVIRTPGRGPTGASPTPPAATSRPAIPTRPAPAATVTPGSGVAPLQPRTVGALPAAVNEPDLSVAQAEEILRNRYGWRPPAFRGYTLQVSSFQRLANAVNFRNHLGAKGYEAYLDVAEVRGGAYFRVFAGVFQDAAAAREHAAEFQAQHGDTYKVFVRKR